MRQFVADFVSCVSAKYYLHWFTVEEGITKIRVNFLLRSSVESLATTYNFATNKITKQ